VWDAGIASLPFNGIWWIFVNIIWGIAFIPEAIVYCIYIPMFVVALITNGITYLPHQAALAWIEVVAFIWSPLYYWNHYPTAMITRYLNIIYYTWLIVFLSPFILIGLVIDNIFYPFALMWYIFVGLWNDMWSLLSPFFLFNEYPFMRSVLDAFYDNITAPIRFLYDPVDKIR